MDNQRLLVWAIFGLMVWFTYQAWVQDYAPRSAPASTTQPQQPAATEATPELPDIQAAGDEPAALPDAGAPATSDAATPEDAGETITIRTDVLDLHISTRGGTLMRALLRRYPVHKDQPDTLVELLSPAAGELGRVQTGLRSTGEGAEPNHLAAYTTSRSTYELGDADQLQVPLVWTSGDGLSVEKTITLRRGSYIVGIEHHVRNDSATDWRGAAYAQLQRRNREPERSMFDVDSYSFDGPIIYDGQKSTKLKRDDLLDDGPFSFNSANGWIASIQHHFLTAVVPPAGEEHRYNVSVRGDVSTASGIGPVKTVAPGEIASFSTTAFVGPKLQAQLETIDPKLKLTVDYGWLTIIAEPLFWLLSKIYGMVGNWGVAIIIVTILIKLAFYKLTEASGRSMAKMREIQPRMKALQERYKDDRQALSQAMMELYQREKVNPAAGCLPILIQMPFFLAFYWVLLESVEMRQAPFALWITDLSSRDPFFILPLIMGAAMLLQQRLNPAPADPVQARVMQIMPIMFTAFFAFFPSGLVLYWVTNTVLSIAQQWHINKVVSQEGKQQGGKAKKKGK
ncbi:MAG: membrane protein insertase YidC [Gammaproteobacteria bacterium]|nr:membrane protein insertase YidC [Gammaproteobacteria bacterium]MDH4254682.1 membrane protein insertase YidC [Gammaproteobacteria bacterium]MDH5310020.1 membrane protein insertase YidC [Gammaproteobacteria bacterium]